MINNPPANAGDIRDAGSTPGSGRSSAGGNGNPLQYSGLENPMDRGAWWATLDGVAKSRTRLKRLSIAPPLPGACPLGADGSGNQFLGTISLWARWSYQ